MPREAALTAGMTGYVADLPGSGIALPAETRHVTNERPCLTASAAQAAAPVVTDGNGCPLGSMTWHEAVWIANPPESIPGS